MSKSIVRNVVIAVAVLGALGYGFFSISKRNAELTQRCTELTSIAAEMPDYINETENSMVDGAYNVSYLRDVLESARINADDRDEAMWYLDAIQDNLSSCKDSNEKAQALVSDMFSQTHDD